MLRRRPLAVGYPFSWVARASFLVLALLGGWVPAAGATTLLGPSPYLGFGDSPFSGGSFTAYFYLEDFEDGLLNTPGVSASFGFALSPAPLTDSVDPGGYSFYAGDAGVKSITFTFDEVALGSLPSHVGIVWTDVGFEDGGVLDGVADVIFEAFDADGLSLGSIGPVTLGDGAFDGGTAEDRFFGAIDLAGISKITITMPTSGDWEVDHLQYGLGPTLVPEPATGMLALLGLGGLGVAGRARRRG